MSGIPTPGRIRSASAASQQPGLPTQESDTMSRAFADAIKANDPALHRTGRISEPANPPLSPKAPLSFLPQSGRRSVAGRPSSSASASSLPEQLQRDLPCGTHKDPFHALIQPPV
jgi:CAP-Gly domain-containing linker protein 1